MTDLVKVCRSKSSMNVHDNPKTPSLPKEAVPRKLTLNQMFDLSRAKWGLDFQLQMLVEELCELSVATLHLNRRIKNKTIHDQRVNAEKFAEEIADVELMLEEMKYYYENAWLVKYFRKLKEERLQKRYVYQNGVKYKLNKDGKFIHMIPAKLCQDPRPESDRITEPNTEKSKSRILGKMRNQRRLLEDTQK